MFIMCVLLSFVLGVYSEKPLRVWSLVKNKRELGDKDPLSVKHKLDIQFGPFAASFSPANARKGEVTSEVFYFDLPVFGTQECVLFPSSVLAPELAQKYPNVVTRKGKCNHGEVKMDLSLQLDVPTSFTATFSIPGRNSDWFYVDHNSEEHGYELYAKSSSKYDPKPSVMSCDTVEDKHDSNTAPVTEEDGSRRRLYSGDYVGSGLRLAIAATPEFVAASGGTLSSTLNRVVGVINRVNAVYTRELGIYFQLAADTDLLFCVPGVDCSSIPDSSYESILYNIDRFVSGRGVSSTSFDIGHVFKKAFGGVVSTIGALCTSTKMQGITGSEGGNTVFVDVLCHELGHMMGARHTQRDCHNSDPLGAVEPGSGSTTMSYGTNNICRYPLQKNYDQYFHPTSLLLASEFIHTKLAASTCAPNLRVTRPSSTRPEITSATPTCTIPVGNYFGLFMNATRADTYQWDHENLGEESFTDISIPRFRSWTPREEKVRYFPNLYYLTHGLDNVTPYFRFERLPSRDTTMTFRFVARSHSFSPSTTSPQLIEEEFGDFATRNVVVNFRTTLAPLRFTNSTKTTLQTPLQAGKSLTLYWNAGGAGANAVKLMITFNPMSTIYPRDDFVSSSDIVALDWILIGVFSNTGSATVVLPAVEGPVGLTKAAYMIQSADVVECFAFDFATGPFVNPQVVPTRSPAVFQTLFPSRSPSRAVTQPPPFLQIFANQFSAPSPGMYTFTTQPASNNSCTDTVLAVKSKNLCNDDAYGSYSQLTFSLTEGEQVFLIVGSFSNGCRAGENVALKVEGPSTFRPTPLPTLPTTFPTMSPTSLPTPYPTLATMSPANFPTLSFPPIFSNQDAVEQTLYTCDAVSDFRCGVTCATGTKYVGYSFTTPFAGMYTFTTQPASNNSCADTVLAVKSKNLCSDDAYGRYSRLIISLTQGEQVFLIVGSYNNGCQEGENVALKVNGPNTLQPSYMPSFLTMFPTSHPTLSPAFATNLPTTYATSHPTLSPTSATDHPTLLPTFSTNLPTTYDTTNPSMSPTFSFPAIFANEDAVVQSLYLCDATSDARCAVTCAGATKSVVYSFTALSTGLYLFQTQAATINPCTDTTLAVKSKKLCGDDSSGSNKYSYLIFWVVEGEQVLLIVGSYENTCPSGSLVALEVKGPLTIPPTRQAETPTP